VDVLQRICAKKGIDKVEVKLDLAILSVHMEGTPIDSLAPRRIIRRRG
jgi:hypothetical protein